MAKRKVRPHPGVLEQLLKERNMTQEETAKLAAEGVAYYRTKVEGLPAPSGDDRYSLFGETDLHPFFRWIGELITIKTPELEAPQHRRGDVRNVSQE